VPDDGSRVLEKLSLQPALEGAQRQFRGVDGARFTERHNRFGWCSALPVK